MKKILLSLSVIVTTLANAQVYPSLNVNLLSTLSPCTVNNWYATGGNTKYSSVVGWVHPTSNKEFAIMGATDGYYFIDVTNPTTPVLCDFEVGINTNALWREMKTYGNYAYMVSDDSNPNGFIIADLSYLPDSIHVVHKSNSILSKCHTLFIDGNKLYCGGPTTISGAKNMQVYSLANPEVPSLLRTLSQDYPTLSYVHDMWVQNDTVFASCGNQGLHIYKFNTNNTFTELASFTGYVQAGYNHSSYRTTNKNTLVFCDEVPTNTVVKILDVSNLSNLTLLDTIKSNQGATPHNPYVLGDSLALVSYYQDGMYIFDISNPSNVSVAGFFDTHYQNGLNNNYPGTPSSYMGAWACWPYLPSGNVLVSDMQNGLFVLDITGITTSVKKNSISSSSINLYPNPSQDQLNLAVYNQLGDVVIDITDMSGRKIYSTKTTINSNIYNTNVDVKDFASGMYLLSVSSKNGRVVKQFVKE